MGIKYNSVLFIIVSLRCYVFFSKGVLWTLACILELEFVSQKISLQAPEGKELPKTKGKQSCVNWNLKYHIMPYHF